MKIADRGAIFSGQKDTDRQSCSFPSICILPDGRWICAFRAAPSKTATTGQHVLMTWSDDEGESWCNPFNPFVPPSIEGKPGLFRSASLTTLSRRRVLATLYWLDHSDPSLPIFNDKTEGVLDSRIFFAESDDGANWTDPSLMDTSPFNVPTAITGPALLLPNGDIACQFELFKSYYDTSATHHSSVLMFSKNGGKSWPEHIITGNDPGNRIFYWDQRPGLLANGTILNLFWPYDNQTHVYLNAHARESLDNGRRWSAIWNTGVPGQPSAPVSLLDGRIAMVYVDRTTVPVIKMRVAEDNGRIWPDKSEIIIHRAEGGPQTGKRSDQKDAWAEMGKFSIGLPQSALLQNGDILVVYYAGPDADQTDIHWVRVRIK